MRTSAAHDESFQMVKCVRPRGFTLIEIMIVITIISLLVGLGRFAYRRARQQAENTATLGAAKAIASDFLVKLSASYDSKHKWGAAYNKAYLNGALQSALENKPSDNVYRYKNPGSGSRRVVNSASVPARSRNAAIFITNNKNYAYDTISKKKAPELAGTVVIWMANGTAAADIFYVDAWGGRSAFRISY